jgi:hypothetical protein
MGVGRNMRKKKKWLFKLITAYVLMALILSSGTSSVKVYAYDSTIKIDIGENFAASGSQVRLPVHIGNLPQNGLTAANFVIEFDDDLVINDVKAGEIVKNSSDLSYYVKFNKLYILFSDSTGGTYPLKDEGNLCYLTFSINASSSKNNFIVKRIPSDNEIFADNQLKELKAEFSEGSVIKKDKLYRVQSGKTWRITFNHEIRTESLLWNSYQIKSISGQNVSADYKISSDGKTLEILPPKEGYELNNSYFLTLRNTILSKYGKNLSKEEVIYFYIDR